MGFIQVWEIVGPLMISPICIYRSAASHLKIEAPVAFLLSTRNPELVNDRPRKVAIDLYGRIITR
jgi:hypothetical protein